MHAFVKKWVSCFRFCSKEARRLLHLVSILSRSCRNLGRELLGEALLLGPLVVVGGGVLFEDLDVLGDEVLAAEGADGHGLSGLDGSAVLVDLDASAGSVGLLVLALDAVLLGDRHGERCWCGVLWWCCCGYCRVEWGRWDLRKLGRSRAMEREKTLLSQGNFLRGSFGHEA